MRAAVFSALLLGTSTFAAPSRRDNTTATRPCADACLTKVDLKGCPTTDGIDCLCKADFNVQAPLLKCVFDSCDINQAGDAFSSYGNACDFEDDPKGSPFDQPTDIKFTLTFGIDATVTGSPTSTSTSSTVSSSTPTPTVAPSFNLPSCGQSCINKDNIKGCNDTLTPNCVCGDSTLDPDTDANNTGAIYKCLLDSCGTVDASVSFYQFGVDCGFYSNQTAAKDLFFPFNAFAAATTASSSSTSSTSSTSGPSASPTGKHSGATVYGASSTVVTVGVAVVLGFFLF